MSSNTSAFGFTCQATRLGAERQLTLQDSPGHCYTFVFLADAISSVFKPTLMSGKPHPVQWSSDRSIHESQGCQHHQVPGFFQMFHHVSPFLWLDPTTCSMPFNIGQLFGSPSGRCNGPTQAVTREHHGFTSQVTWIFCCNVLLNTHDTSICDIWFWYWWIQFVNK